MHQSTGFQAYQHKLNHRLKGNQWQFFEEGVYKALLVTVYFIKPGIIYLGSKDYPKSQVESNLLWQLHVGLQDYIFSMEMDMWFYVWPKYVWNLVMSHTYLATISPVSTNCYWQITCTNDWVCNFCSSPHWNLCRVFQCWRYGCLKCLFSVSQKGAVVITRWMVLWSIPRYKKERESYLDFHGQIVATEWEGNDPKSIQNSESFGQNGWS